MMENGSRLASLATSALRAAFPEVPFQYRESARVFANLPGPCAQLSPLEISDDGDEITAFLGAVTHAHVGCYDDELSAEQREERIVRDLVAFVRDLLDDRIVATTALGGRLGGWRRIEIGEPLPSGGRIWQRYVWSGPLL